MNATGLTPRQQQILQFIDTQISGRGYPPSVREICDAVGLTSPSTVHSHLTTLQDRGFIRRDPSKPRAIEIRFDPTSGAAVMRGAVRHVPLVGDVAAGGPGVLAAQNVEESLPLPAEFTGDGELFMLRVRGDSMIGAGILDGDHVVARVQQTAENGDLVVAGIDSDDGTVKHFYRDGPEIVLVPSNPNHQEIRRMADEVTVYGRVVTVLRRI
ncbi:MAG: transcriptional repressor LexA [Acidimicrobiales bacterium]|jgi:repressor LexA|nr:transcriptional repressor LexA [Acidimicrobiales bacterium]